MIYLDNNATTRLDSIVLEKMLPYLQEDYANASSVQHRMGRTANQALTESRNAIASKLGVLSKEIIFTSGATESINIVLRGVFNRYKIKGNHIITCQTEHKAVLTTCESLAKIGAQITYLPVNAAGAIDTEQLKAAITSKTILVCIMSANNETGVLQPIKSIASICQEKNILFFSDTTQSIGKQEFDLNEYPLDFCCLSAHKFHGPKGIGALYMRRGNRPIQIEPFITGGDQEFGIRAGTYNVPAVVGLAEALNQAQQVNFQSVENNRNYLETRLSTEIEECTINGQKADRISNTSNICFKHVPSSELMTKNPQLAISSGSACVTGSRDPSHVLKAMGLEDEHAFCSIRFSLSKYTTIADIDLTVERIKAAVQTIRQQSPIWQMYKSGLLG